MQKKKMDDGNESRKNKARMRRRSVGDNVTFGRERRVCQEAKIAE